jgi:D-alanyl-lipoteichoic acid acyltransferase DltB (MBOAT superfamily)
MFQAISYLVDIYRENVKNEKSLLLLSNYIIFFPQLIAGPILRFDQIVPQFRRNLEYSPSFIKMGIDRILGGLLLKVVIADNIAKYVNEGFSADPSLLSGIDTITLSFLFGFQIYFDFAGYSHIAIGSAMLLGIYIPENFQFPYHSVSFKNFWERWHISLSNFIKDYIYKPLCGFPLHRTSDFVTPQRARLIVGLLATWVIMGLWHGAAWKFAVWGLVHFGLISLERLITKIAGRPLWFFGVYQAVVILLIMLSWILFRAEDLEHAALLYRRLFDWSEFLSLGMRENTYLVAAILTVSYLIFPRLKRSVECSTLSHNTLFCGFRVMLSVIILLIYMQPIDQFIYFQF